MAFPALSGLSGCDRVPTASSAAPRACPRSKTSAAPPACPPQQLQQKKLPSTSRWVAAKSFLTVSRPPPPPSKPSNPPQRLEPPPCLHPRAARWPPSPFLRFRDRRLPPSKPSNPPQRLKPAPLQPVPLNSSNKKNLHPRAAGWPQSRFSRFRDRRLPPSKASNPPQRLEPAPLSGSRPPQKPQTSA